MLESIKIAHKAMGICIESIEKNKVILSLPYAPNVNDKGTLFAGSIFSVATLAGWTLAMHYASISGFDKPWAAVTHIEGDFKKALKTDCKAVATCAHLPQLNKEGKNWIDIIITIDEAFILSARYAVGNKK